MKNYITFLFISMSFITFGQSKITSEEILIKNDSIELPGTLSFTQTNTPLIIWIHGSGNIDRNGNQGSVIKANYIQQFRDSINQKGFAFFSYDKRTAHKKNFPFLKNTLFADFVEDAKKVINHFKHDKRFTKIILIGHSQGSLVAMLASKNADIYISLAGPSRPLDEVLIEQINKQSPFMTPFVKAHLKELKETGNIKKVNPLLASLFKKENQPFLADWMRFNPSEEIKKLTIPILLINGDKDLQVPISDAEMLHKANPKSKLILIKNMNHVLKNIVKDEDNMNSYYNSNYPISTQLVNTVANFIKDNH